MIHALLVVFDDPINLDEFAMLTAEQETRHLQEIAQELPHIGAQEFAGLISRVLLIDDQVSDRKLISHWLNRSGMQVTAVAEAASAIAQLQRHDFDLMIVDIRLGSEDGAGLIREARVRRFVEPVLAISADESDATRNDALAAGANAFLSKPFSEQALTHTSKRLMGFDPESDDSPIFSTFRMTRT